MIQLRRLHIQSIVLGVLVTLAAVALASYATVSASPVQQDERQTVTVTGYVTQHLDDNQILFTDGSNTVQVEVENVRASELPLNTPLTITAQILEADDGKFKVKLVSVDEASGDTDVTVALPVTTVSEIQAMPVNDSRVVLQGQITQRIDDGKYLFTDGSGMTVLNIDESVPASAIPLNQPMIVFGVVDEDDGRVEINVTGMQPA